MDNIVELLPVEFLVQCLRLTAEEVEIPQSIFCQRKVIVIQEFVQDMEYELRYTNLSQDKEETFASFYDPVKIRIISQTLAKPQGAMKLFAVSLGGYFPPYILVPDLSINPLFRPPRRHTQTPESIFRCRWYARNGMEGEWEPCWI